MRFASPQFLYSLPALWIVLWLVLKVGRQRRQSLLKQWLGNPALAWADTGHSSARKKWDKIMWFVVLSALVATLARPLYFHYDERNESQGASYLFAFDVSRSMLAKDLKPSRYAATTNALDRFFSEVRSDRIGLITYAGVGYLNAPLTFDSRALRTILSYVNPAALMDPGSSMASAMDRAVRYFNSNHVAQRTLVIISDGEELDNGRALQLARILQRDHRVTIHTIGVGTAMGAKIPAYRTPILSTAHPPTNFFPGMVYTQAVATMALPNGSSPEITTKLDENYLRRIANAGGGNYFWLGQNGEGLWQLREQVLKPLAEKIARDDLQNYREAFFLPLGLALFAFLAKIVLGADRFARPRTLPSIMEAQS